MADKIRILVDGDACPVINIIEEIAREYNLELYIFFDVNHDITINYGQKVRVDEEYQEADMKIYNSCKKKDIVITGDYGLACILIGKGVTVIDPRGNIFSDYNIEYLLMQRHQSAKIRRATGRQQSHKRRKKEDDFKFVRVLKKEISAANKND